MFKKTLLAASLAALSTGALAVDVSTASTANAQVYGNEGLASGLVKNDGTALTLGDITLTLGAEYSIGDTISITISGGEFDPTDSFTLTDTNGDTGSVDVVLGLLSATEDTLLFRITDLDTTNGATTIGETLDLAAGGSVPVILSSIAVGSKVNVSASAATSTGLAIDVTGAKDSVAIGSVAQQHKFTISPTMSADIDVASQRKVFATAADATFDVAYTATTVDQAGMTLTDTTYTINGSMTGFEDSIATADNDGTVVGTAGAYTVAADLQSASSTTGAGPAANEVVLFTVDSTAADRVVLNVSDYTVDVEIEETGGKSVTYSGIVAGSFSLNGSSAQYAYAPIGYDAVTTQFEIGNSGTVDGEITITAFDTDGNDYEAMLPFKAEAGKLTRVADSDISTAFGLTEGTKLNLTFTVNAPEGDITYGAYSNRGTTGRMALTKELVD